MRTPEQCQSLTQLADTVWTERNLLTTLLYRLTAAKLLLAADERRFVPSALDELEQAAAAVRDIESRRLLAIAEVSREWQVPADELTLGRIVDEAPEPWATMFTEHREALNELTDRIERTATENQRLANGALTAIRNSMEALTGPKPDTYDATGHAYAAAGATPVSYDRAI